jgi:ABC-type antimicrobial peptide transport system permease subunit
MSIALAGVGLSGLLGYLVSARRRELGIRAALGATPARVGFNVLSESLRLVGWGVGAGLLGAVAAAHGMRTLLFGVGPADLASYAAAMALLGATGIAASWWPARRAMSVDPVETLRAE